MSAKKPDIALIRKYLNGELDARAMFELERQAEADPFLWDMIKGMEAATANDQVILDEIDALINKRFEKNKKRIIPLWTILSIAASLFIAMGIGGWWLMQHRTEVPLTATNIKHADKKDLTKTNKATKAAPALKADTVKIIAKLNHIPSKSIRKPVVLTTNKKPIDSIKSELTAIANPYKTPNYGHPKPESMTIGKSDMVFGKSDMALAKSKSLIPDSSKRLKEVLIRGYGSIQKSTITGAVSTINAQELKRDSNSNIGRLSGRVAGVAIQDKIAGSVNTSRMITGIVVDKKDNSPIPGVAVTLKDRTQGVTTNINGHFSIKVPANTETLVVNFIGYTSQQVNVKNKTDLKVSLSQNGQMLSEVVIGYGATSTDDHVYQGAHPNIGWDRYDKYLKESTIAPDGKTGVVRLAFTVNRDGSISNIIVKKSLSPEMDQKAIDIVKNGPRWVGEEDGKPAIKRLRIKFHK